MDARILVADDEPDILDALELLLKPRGYRVQTVSSPGAVLDALRADRFDLLIMDLNYARGTTSGEEGLDLLQQVESWDAALPVVVMTAWSSVEVAVQAMRGRLRDFVQKPWDNDELLATLEEQIERGRRLRARKRENDEAREIQRRLLPASIPEPAGYRIATSWRPARNVGGDYFDVLDLGGGSTALCIGDVVGKGLPAALLMSNVQATVRVFASSKVAPSAVCENVNRVLSRNLAANKFVSFFYGVLDAASGRLRYVNAGHNPPILIGNGGQARELHEGGTPLGVNAERRYAEGEVRLQEGDRLLLFTDGLTEAEDADGNAFGPQRLRDLLRTQRGGAREALEKVMATVMDFCADPERDDATAVLLARKPGSSP